MSVIFVSYWNNVTFVQAFYSFTFEINNADRGYDTKLRVKIPRHPEEDLFYFFARIVAFLHAYSPGLEFSKGLFDLDEPTLWRRNSIGDVEQWAEVGSPRKKKLVECLRAHPAGAVYFYHPSQVQEMCHLLRGSKTNWIEPVAFYFVQREGLEALFPLLRSSAHWQLTIVDDAFYLLCDGTQVELFVTKLNMWDEYQRSLTPA